MASRRSSDAGNGCWLPGGAGCVRDRRIGQRGAGRERREVDAASLQPHLRQAQEDFDGGFQFCRLVFRNATNGDGAGWSVDWPRADENLSIRLSERTRIPVSMDETGQPKHLLDTVSHGPGDLPLRV